MNTHTLHFQPNPASQPRTRLARLGDWMARHRSSIAREIERNRSGNAYRLD